MLGRISLAETQFDQKLGDFQHDTKLHSGTGRDINVANAGRRARAIVQTAKGTAAVQKLLKGAEKVKTTSKNFRNYRKDGGYETALADLSQL